LQGTQRDQAGQEKSDQKTFPELQTILMGLCGLDHSEEDHEEADENIR
jgi:hypothetical protein